MATAERLNLRDADTYITLSGVSWAGFEEIADRTRGGRIRYENGDLTILSPSFYQKEFLASLRDLVAALCEATEIEERALGSTTWKNPAAEKGDEADCAYYLDPAKVTAAEKRRGAIEEDITRFPPPDLAIEIDLRRPDPRRASVHATVGTVEIWEYDGESARIGRLGPDGLYAYRDRSGWFPISADEIALAVAHTPCNDWPRRRWLLDYLAEHIPPPED